jgi:hypothetical protein
MPINDLLFIVHFPNPDQIEDPHVVTENWHVTWTTFASCSTDTCAWQEYIHLCSMYLLFDGSCVWFGAHECICCTRSWTPGFGGPFFFKTPSCPNSVTLCQAACLQQKAPLLIGFGVAFRGKNMHKHSCWSGSLGPWARPHTISHGTHLFPNFHTVYVLFDGSSIWFDAFFPL